ncbi:hypothetical protein BDV12DRAFT_188828 [Aspergillus spectabilis]
MEKPKEKPPPATVVTDIAAAESQSYSSPRAWLPKLAAWGIEVNGVSPVPLEEKTDKRFINVFFVWFTMSTNLLPIVTGMVGTISFGLSLRDASLVILFFGILCTVPPAFMSTFGARTGLRQMLQARFTYGYYLISIIIALNLCTIAGFGIIDCVLSGMTLAAVSGGNIDATTGIVIIAICGVVISAGGYKVLHQFEQYSWISALIAITIATGVGGKHLSKQGVTEPPTPASIISFGGIIAGFLVPWATMASDFTVYCHPSVSSFRIFTYTYAGLFAPTIPLMCLGAAIGGAVSNIPAWASGNASYSAGGVLEAILPPLGGFGKSVSVLLSFSLLGNLAAAIYSISLNFQLLIPSKIAQKVPRVIFTIVYMAAAIPVAIFAAKSFFSSLENFLYVIAYWSAAAVGADWRKYDHVSCGMSSRLPSGIAAIAAMGSAFGLVVPCMSQVWYTGPLAEETGDIGFEVALVLAPLLYLPLRWVEVRWRGCCF